jgi:AcrR family transcriptional regulator
MSPRQPDPLVRVHLVEAAAQLLATEGRDAVTARRVAGVVGASTQAVYTHFGGMDELLAEIWREGFRRFGEVLDEPAVTDDPVADWMAQGWGYRRFALRDQHLYRVMFGEGLVAFRLNDERDRDAASGTFLSLLARIERCVDAGRWMVDDVYTAGELVWMTVHGHCTIELTGYFDHLDRDPVRTYEEGLRRTSLGFGDHPERSAVSLQKARRRAARAEAA